MKRALITGVRGQDGSYLAESLLEKGYKVFGLMPHRNHADMSNLLKCLEHPDYHTVDGDMTDPHSLDKAVSDTAPDEIYNLAAQSFVGKSWKMPAHTTNVNYMGFTHLLEAVVRNKLITRTRVYQASTSEMFGSAAAPQNEETQMDPCSPYGVGKLAAHKAAANYRDSYGMFVCCGILFNHESVRRPEHFLTQKVAKAAAHIARADQKRLKLGNLEAKRDWGWAPDYVEAMHSMLQRAEPEDFVIGTGRSHTVEEFVKAAFNRAGLDWKQHVDIDPELVRPVDVPELRADMRKARQKLDWFSDMRFYDLVHIMVDHWMEKLA